MSEETIQNQHAPLTTETIVGQAFLPVHLARRHAPLGRPVGTYLRDVPSSAPDDTVEYGHDGNMLTYGGWTFTWNGENRLISATDGTTTISNAYDYMGRRFSKVVNGVTNTFLYDGWAMIREESMTTTNHYVYGLDLSGSMQGAGTIGGILAADLNGTTAFYCYDANGNVTDLIGTNGSSVAHYEYDPFGNTIAQSGTLADENPFRFSTKYLDDETGFYYYGYRYYNPQLGRWVNRDPITEYGWAIAFGERLDINYSVVLKIGHIEPLYLAAWNDTIDNVDYLGLRRAPGNPVNGCCTCGPEHKEALITTLIDVRQRFNALSWMERNFRQCNPLNWIGVWDIHFKSDPNCGGCKETVMVGGICYDKWEVNYLLFGVMSRLCNNTQLAMRNNIRDWKRFGKPFVALCNGEEITNELTPTVIEFAEIGWREFPREPIFRSYLDHLPPSDNRLTECKDCGVEIKGKLRTDWPY
jgi:RHS repeat-associated protein